MFRKRNESKEESKGYSERGNESDQIKKEREFKITAKKVKETLVAPKSTPPLPSPYKTPQTIGKAIKKAIQSLTPSARQKQCIVKRLANEVGLAVASPKKKIKNGLNDDIIVKLKKCL